jgi:hypothetical protein
MIAHSQRGRLRRLHAFKFRDIRRGHQVLSKFNVDGTLRISFVDVSCDTQRESFIDLMYQSCLDF